MAWIYTNYIYLQNFNFFHWPMLKYYCYNTESIQKGLFIQFSFFFFFFGQHKISAKIYSQEGNIILSLLLLSKLLSFCVQSLLIANPIQKTSLVRMYHCFSSSQNIFRIDLFLLHPPPLFIAEKNKKKSFTFPPLSSQMASPSTSV